MPGTLSPANSAGNDIEAYPGSYALSYGLWFKYKKSGNGSSSSRQPIGNLASSNPPSGQVKVGWYIDDSDSKLRQCVEIVVVILLLQKHLILSSQKTRFILWF